MGSPEHHDIDKNLDALLDTSNAAKRSLWAANKWSRLTIAFRLLIAVGVILTAIFAGYVVAQLSEVQSHQTTTLELHSLQIDWQNKVLESLCQHTEGCVIPGPPPTKIPG